MRRRVVEGGILPGSAFCGEAAEFLSLKRFVETASTTVFCQTSFGFPSCQVEPRRVAAVLGGGKIPHFSREAAKFVALKQSANSAVKKWSKNDFQIYRPWAVIQIKSDWVKSAKIELSPMGGISEKPGMFHK